MREAVLDREGSVSIGNRKRKQGHRPERARLVVGEGLGIAKRANEAALCKT